MSPHHRNSLDLTPVLGHLAGHPADPAEGRVGQYPLASLEADRKQVGRFRLVMAFGPHLPPRRERTGRALTRSSRPTVGVEVVRDEAGSSRLMVRDARKILPWMRDLIPGRFDDPGGGPLALELVVLAIAGHDARGLDRLVGFRDGNPLNCVADNLVLLQGSTVPSITLDDVAHLAVVPDAHDRDGYEAYLAELLEVARRRFHRITSHVRILEEVQPDADAAGPSLTAVEDEARKPHFVAEVVVHGRSRGNRIKAKQKAKVQASNPHDARFFGELEALRRLIFHGYDVAYCGTLLKSGRLRVDLAPKDPVAGSYRLTIRFDCYTPVRSWEPRRVQLPYDRYEMEARLDHRPGSLSPFLLVVGIPDDIKQAFARFLDFSRTVRLHRLVLALDEVSMLDAADDLLVRREVWGAIAPNVAPPSPLVLVEVPVDPEHPGTGGIFMLPEKWSVPPFPVDESESYHGHHLFGLRHWNHRWQLTRKTERRHKGSHTEWREVLNDQHVVLTERVKVDAATVHLRRDLSVPSQEAAGELHYKIDADLRHSRWGNGRRKWSREEQEVIDAILGNYPRISSRQTVAGLLKSIQEAGNALPIESLASRSPHARETTMNWLRKLLGDGWISIDKNNIVRVDSSLPSPFPVPRKQRRRRRTKG